VCQHFQKPTQKDLRAVKHILRYIKGTLTHGLRYLNQSSLNLIVFCDADWAGCPTTRRSTTGFCVYLGSHCISWASKKQPTVSRSSAEAEYRALATTAAELTWLQYLLHDLGIPLEHRPLIFCDNQSVIHMSHNSVFHARTKHIAIDYHFIREKVTSGDLRLRYLPTTQQIADVFTKSLPKDSFSIFRSKLGVHSLSLPSLKGGCKEPKHEHLK
jgi:histone deacetylase 1/2